MLYIGFFLDVSAAPVNICREVTVNGYNGQTFRLLREEERLMIHAAAARDSFSCGFFLSQAAAAAAL